MSEYRHLDVAESDGVTLVRFHEQKIIDDLNIEVFSEELNRLVDEEGRTKLLLNFAAVAFLSSSTLRILIKLHKKVTEAGGALKLCQIRPEIYEVFTITNLHHLFEIKDTEAEAFAAF